MFRRTKTTKPASRNTKHPFVSARRAAFVTFVRTYRSMRTKTTNSASRNTKHPFVSARRAAFVTFVRRTHTRPLHFHSIVATIPAMQDNVQKQILYPDEVYAIQGAIFEVYREMGNGFREEVYQQCLERELAARKIPFASKPELVISYKGVPIEKTYIPDLLCYGTIIVELKATQSLSPEHVGQVLNYLRVTKNRLGLLVNFAAYPKAEIKRIVL